jgi:5-methylcytosine-specific restriction endonuclease McrA
VPKVRDCVCRECGVAFRYDGPGHRPPLECGTDCRTQRSRRRDRARRPRMTELRTGVCEDCGTETVAGLAGSVPRRCAPCVRAFYVEYHRVRDAERRPRQPAKRKDCELCDATYDAPARNTTGKYCGACREGIHYLYRATRASRLAKGAESFPAREIYERDGWVCQLCFDPVDPEARWGDPWYASLDHIIPLSRGGPHARANVQLAHQRCNRRKWAHMPGEVTL